VFWFTQRDPRAHWIPSRRRRLRVTRHGAAQVDARRTSTHQRHPAPPPSDRRESPARKHASKSMRRVVRDVPYHRPGGGRRSIDQVIADGSTRSRDSARAGRCARDRTAKTQCNEWAGATRAAARDDSAENCSTVFGVSRSKRVGRKTSVLDAVSEDLADLSRPRPPDRHGWRGHSTQVRELERAGPGLPSDYGKNLQGARGLRRSHASAQSPRSVRSGRALRAIGQTRVASYMLTKCMSLRGVRVGTRRCAIRLQAPTASARRAADHARHLPRHVEEFEYCSKMKATRRGGGDGTLPIHTCVVSRTAAEANSTRKRLACSRGNAEYEKRHASKMRHTAGDIIWTCRGGISSSRSRRASRRRRKRSAESSKRR